MFRGQSIRGEIPERVSGNLVVDASGGTSRLERLAVRDVGDGGAGNVFELLRITGTAIRSHPGSAIPLSKRRAPGSVFYALLRHRSQPRVSGVDCQAGDGQDHHPVSSAGEVSQHGTHRVSISDAMQLARVHALPAGRAGL